MQRSTHLTRPTGLRRPRAPVPQPEPMSAGLAEGDGQQEAGQQTSALTITLFVAGGIAFAWWVSQEPNQVVAPAPGPA